MFLHVLCKVHRWETCKHLCFCDVSFTAIKTQIHPKTEDKDGQTLLLHVITATKIKQDRTLHQGTDTDSFLCRKKHVIFRI